ncbi:MAG: STAS domain-containing protein [Anaerolineae bacterium]
MELIHRTVNSVDVLELSGRFDAYEVPMVVEWFEANPDVKQVVVNLHGVGFIDSSGLSALVKGLKRCRQNNGDLYLSNPQQAVSIIFELTRFDKAFSIYDEVQNAIEGFST